MHIYHHSTPSSEYRRQSITTSKYDLIGSIYYIFFILSVVPYLDEPRCSCICGLQHPIACILLFLQSKCLSIIEINQKKLCKHDTSLRFFPACYVIINLIFAIERSHELQIAWMKLNAFILDTFCLYSILQVWPYNIIEALSALQPSNR